ncbi:MAG: RNA-directed DNA polymerase [Bacteroidales bacterium]|nr:RNA-directed DNA polymerase [Bacteroidales bacterium]
MTNLEIAHAASRVANLPGLLALLNRIKEDEFGNRVYPFTLQELNYYINPKRSRSGYRIFSIPKKNGGDRTIASPVKILKSFQICVNRLLQALYEVPECVCGFVPGRSVADNAARHTGMRFVFNADLQDFFTSIPQARVWGALKTRPFSFPPVIASALAGLCCMEVDGADGPRYVLPQGGPASPVITNIVCHNLDWKLSGLARRFHLHYSRYADDITFSGDHFVYEEGGVFLTEFRRIVAEQNFRLNDKKTRLNRRGERQEVTGLVVSDRVNVPREYVRDLDNLLFIWERYGRDAAYAKFLSRYTPKKGRMVKKPDMEAVVRGRISYLKMVKGADSPVWKRLRKRFDILIGRAYFSTTTCS